MAKPTPDNVPVKERKTRIPRKIAVISHGVAYMATADEVAVALLRIARGEKDVGMSGNGRQLKTVCLDGVTSTQAMAMLTK